MIDFSIFWRCGSQGKKMKGSDIVSGELVKAVEEVASELHASPEIRKG